MKKTVIVSLIAFIGIIVSYLVYDQINKRTIILNIDPIKNGIVYNEDTAIKLAEVIWLSIYGNEIYKHKPFKATLQDSVWVVDGTVYSKLGGAPHIVIQKKDGKIIDVTHFK